MATSFSARSVIAARSTSLSGGAIAGAVIGSVVGALLIFFCLFPFIVRARRRRLAHHDDSAQAELGLSPGGPLHPDMVDAVKRLSTDHSVPGPDTGFPAKGTNAFDPYQKAASVDSQGLHQKPSIPPNVAIHQGLPSPISPPISPTDRSSSTPTQALEGVAPPSTDPTSTSKSRLSSIGTLGRDNTRELSLTDSHGPSPSTRDITSTGITEEPETFDQSSTQRHFSGIPESIRSFIRRQSGHHRRDSRRSTLGGTEGTRSPSVISETIAQPQLAHPQFAQPQPPVFDHIDFEAPRGEAWSYYNSFLTNEPQDSFFPTSSAPAPATVPTAAPGGLTVIPPAHPSPAAPLSPISPVHQGPAPADAAPFMTARPADELDAISPDSDKTVTSPKDPLSFSRQSSFLTGQKRFPGAPLQRTDSLPAPTIVSDIPSPPLQLSIGPSGNPMEFMKPTTDTESAWKLRQEIIKMEASPPPDMYTPTPELPTVDEAPPMNPNYIITPEPEPDLEYHSPPDIEINGEEIDNFDMLNFPESHDNVDTSDWSTPTPGPSSDLSASNTPDTRLTEASPSPMPDFDSRNGQIGTSPRAFACDQCHRIFDQVHKLNHHKRYHDRPHECTHPGCTMKFGTKTHLDRHRNDKHEKTKKFYCTQHGCPYSRQGGRSFPRKDNWRRHIMNKHQITPESDPGPQYIDELMGGT